ncbi:MAG: peptidyl-prolyl cis-trans isomerase [Candidatus Poribacteria bacterium]|nr:peptidyl-prolyl cis-trans isomerase [Candidatus Poribacteria bacterium]
MSAKSTIIRTCAAACFAALLTTTVSSQNAFQTPSATDGELVDYIAATVNGEAVTLSAVRQELRWRDLPLVDVSEQRRILQLLIQQQLFLEEAQNFVIVSDAAVEREIDRMAGAMSRETYLASRRAAGISEGDVRERVREQLMLFDLVQREFRPKTAEVSVTDIEGYYQANLKEFTLQERYRIEQVFVSSTSDTSGDSAARLTTIRQRLTNGDLTLEDLANETDDDPSLLVVSTPDPQPMNLLLPEFQNALPTLPQDEWSAPISTESGWFLIRVQETLPTTRVPLGTELRTQIQRRLEQQRLESTMNAWLKERETQSDIRILDETLRPDSPPNSPQSTQQRTTLE